MTAMPTDGETVQELLQRRTDIQRRFAETLAELEREMQAVDALLAAEGYGEGRFLFGAAADAEFEVPVRTPDAGEIEQVRRRHRESLRTAERLRRQIER